MSDKLPINKDILVWARTSLGLSIADVAAKLKREEAEITAWESGVQSPTYIQLEKLAYSVYKRPVAVFFFPDIPKEASPKTDFRTLPDTEIENLPAQIIKIYRKAKAFQYNLAELYEGQKPIDNSIIDTIRINENSNIAAVATEIRELLNVSIDEQFAWQSADAAFKAWRQKLEKLGIFIFKDAFKDNSYSGFCLYNKLYPVIYVNNSMPDTRQIFTLFHELGHLLFHAGGIDFYTSEVTNRFLGNYLKIEKICNELAAKILVPDSFIDLHKGAFSERIIEGYAGQFSVSREVILRKYFDARVISKNDYEAFVKKWQKEQANKKQKSGGNYHLTQKAYLGENYINLAYRKYYQHKISDSQLSEYLNIKPKNILNFEHHVLNAGAR
ncbi:MAG: ImmA/IrrE family metallo-endopeptidase [Candidatus Kuenenia stuttgartiensis]|nr:ImmA/IrrE family metallo-endopeptidase [Candidatus Kuenenia stuttgartiensis]